MNTISEGAHPKIEFYKTRTIFLSQRHWWRIVAANGEIVNASSEGFYSKRNAMDNLSLTQQMLYQLNQAGYFHAAYRAISKEEHKGAV